MTPHLVYDSLDQVVFALQGGVQQEGQWVEAHAHPVVDALGARLAQVCSFALKNERMNGGFIIFHLAYLKPIEGHWLPLLLHSNV